MGIGRVASGDFSTWMRGSRISVQAPSDLAPEVIGFGLIAGDPNGPLIRAQDDLDQRPRPERCFGAFHLQRTWFEMIAERKLGVAN